MPIIFNPLPELSERDYFRFYEKYIVGDESECWNWVGGKLGGYARFDWSRGRAEKRSLLAHRIAYFIKHGVDPEKIIVQECGNRMCVNPAHLEAREELTNKQNLQNGDKIGAFTFLERVPAHPDRPTAKFQCECGKEFISRIDAVKSGKTKSCGCKTKELLSKAFKIHAEIEYNDVGIKKMPHFRPEDIRRFWTKVNLQARQDVCWGWLGSNNARYGYFNMGKENQLKANRVAYFLYSNTDPSELHVLHKCDNPKCCNPHHLFLGTHQDNMEDMANKNRSNNQYSAHEI